MKIYSLLLCQSCRFFVSRRFGFILCVWCCNSCLPCLTSASVISPCGLGLPPGRLHSGNPLPWTAFFPSSRNWILTKSWSGLHSSFTLSSHCSSASVKPCAQPALAQSQHFLRLPSHSLIKAGSLIKPFTSGPVFSLCSAGLVSKFASVFVLFSFFQLLINREAVTNLSE